MNYTGRPSISGCRPVLSLYPTHRFCQYLLLIFITFTNSFLFNRAFSTNSRRPLRRAAGVTGPGCALSGASRQLPQRGRSSTSPSLLRNATSPTEGRLWQSPQSERFRQRLPYQGQRRRPPPVAETGRSCWGRGQQDASGSEADAGSRNPALSSEAD